MTSLTLNLKLSILMALIREMAECDPLAYENAFYRSLGASVLDEWTLFRMKGEEVRCLIGVKVQVAA